MIDYMRAFKHFKYRKKRRFGNLLHTGTICAALIVSLGLLGATYASWNQSFNLFGSISTGEVSIIITNVALESSDSYESLSFDTNRAGNVVDEVNMRVVSNANPFNSILVFTVENNGTVPVICEGIDSSVPDSLGVELVAAPDRIEPGQSAPVKVKITKGYVENFEFSTFLRFVQAV
jgi:predicted ribosomally synthesized peptide with SipW-like signal peptide